MRDMGKIKMSTENNINNHLQYKQQQGFSLLELAVVITILSLVIAGGLTLTTADIERKKAHNSFDELARIDAALREYVLRNNRLPCPARLDRPRTDAEYGREATDCADSTPPSGLTRVEYPSASGKYVRIGGVPFYDLRISDKYEADDWGNRYLYAVSESFITSVTETSTGNITVNDDGGNTISDEIAWVVLSHGPTGKGAYRAKTATIATACNTGDKDGENCDNDGIFTDAQYNDGDVSANFFDDIMRWKTRVNLIGLQANENTPTSSGSCTFPAATIPVDAQFLAAGYNNGRIALLDLASGATLATNSDHSSYINTVVISSDGGVFSSADDGYVQKMDSAGNVIFRNSTTSHDIDWSADSSIYAMNSFAYGIRKLSDVDGSDIWAKTLSSFYQPMAIHVDKDNNIILGMGGKLAKLDSSGTEIWGNTSITDTFWSVRSDGNGDIYAFTRSGNYYIRKFSGSDGSEIWSTTISTVSSNVSYCNGYVYAGNTSLIQIDACDGSTVTTKGGYNMIRGIACHSDGSIYVYDNTIPWATIYKLDTSLNVVWSKQPVFERHTGPDYNILNTRITF